MHDDLYEIDPYTVPYHPGPSLLEFLVPALGVLVVVLAAGIIWAVVSGLAPQVAKVLKGAGLVVVWACILLPPLFAFFEMVRSLFT